MLACLILVFCVPSSYQFGSVKAEQVSRLRANRFERNWIGVGNFILISYHVVQSRNIKMVYNHIYMKVEHSKYNIILWIIMTYSHIDIERERASMGFLWSVCRYAKRLTTQAQEIHMTQRVLQQWQFIQGTRCLPLKNKPWEPWKYLEKEIPNLETHHFQVPCWTSGGLLFPVILGETLIHLRQVRLYTVVFSHQQLVKT